MENTAITTTTTPVDLVSAASNFYCSMPIETNEDKAALYNALNNPSVKIADHLNQTIKIRDIIVEPVEVTNEKGEKNIVPRTVIIDTDGASYTAVSSGIYNALKRIASIFGAPSYPDGISVKVVQITAGAKRIYSLQLV